MEGKIQKQPPSEDPNSSAKRAEDRAVHRPGPDWTCLDKGPRKMKFLDRRLDQSIVRSDWIGPTVDRNNKGGHWQ